MVKKEKNIIVLMSSLLFSGVLSIGLCVGWFHKNNSIDIDELTGSVLKKYFEGGDGSEESPFEIARPKQYENFIKLHYEMPDFADRGFYFVFGHNFSNTDGEKDYHFYSYSDDGVFSNVQTDVLNMTSICDESKGKTGLPPLGDEEKPFKAHLDGNNLTVANFRVSASGFKDIGIFGYVSEDASVKNAYFNNFTIDTSTGSYAPGGLDEHTEHEQSSVYVGYLAGHIHNASSFDDVYINNCKLTGSSQLSRTVDEFGYYGHVDIDSLGGQNTGKGGDYRFTLDSEACFNYFNANYSTINKQQLVLRNTQETGWNNEERIGTPENPVSFNEAVSVGSAIGNFGTTYVLSGKNPGSKDVPMTNSLSTIGYVSGPRTVTSVSKEIVYKRDSVGTYETPASDTIITSLPSDDNPDAGNYFYFDGTTWRYYHSENRAIQSDDRFDLILNFNSFKKTVFSGWWANPPKSTNISVTGSIYLDGNLDGTINGVGEASTQRGSFLSNGYSYITVSCNPYRINNLPLGTHYVAAIFNLSYTYEGTDYSAYYAVAGSITDGVVSMSATSGNYVMSVTTKKIASDEYFDFNVMSGAGVSEIPTAPAPVQYEPAPQSTVIVCSATYNDATVYYIDEGSYYPLSNDDENDYSNALFSRTDSGWTSEFTKVVLDDSDESLITNHFTGDEPELVASGYDSRVIDIVGGDTRFWYYNRSFLFGLIKIDAKIISLPSETTSNYVTKSITEDDLGKPFYATQYCPDSIVTYIKNVSNAAAHRNDYLGRIDFQYVSTSQISLSTPVFKKGNGIFNNLANSGVEPEDPMEPANDINRVISRELYEDNVQACSYVALDRDKNILGTFNADGSYGVGMSESKLKDIYYYVLAVGGSGNNNTWITKVQFEYQAEYGYGGTFGNVGYRSSTDPRIEDGTILNFAIIMNEAEASRYEILVYFVKSEDDQSDIIGTYHIEIYTESAVSSGLNVFNYYPNLYEVYIKTSRDGAEQQMEGNSASYVLPGGTY